MILFAMQKHIIETALDIARGLEFLHGPSRRVVHRDLTPRNILLSTAKNNRGFEAKLCDFGKEGFLIHIGFVCLKKHRHPVLNGHTVCIVPF